MHPSSFHLWSSKYPTEKRSRLSRGLLGPHSGLTTPREDKLVKLALNLRRHYIYGLVYSWVLPPLVQLHSGGVLYWRFAYQWKFDTSDGLECDVVVCYLAPLLNVPCKSSCSELSLVGNFHYECLWFWTNPEALSRG